jgi:acyl-CoA thioesterase-1
MIRVEKALYNNRTGIGTQMICRHSNTGAPPGTGFLPYGAPPRSFNVIAAAPVLAAVLLFALAVLAAPPPARASKLLFVLVLGDSLTAGLGLPEEQSFPAQLERALARNGYSATPVINGGVSGDTSAGGLTRLDWLLADKYGKPDLVIVELGANDGMRGLDPSATRANLDRIIRRVRAAGAHVLLAGMRAPPNLGRDYGAAFESLYSELAERHGTAFYPFFLEGVAAVPALNQKDGIHPNAKGVSEIVGRILPVVIEALVDAAR